MTLTLSAEAIEHVGAYTKMVEALKVGYQGAPVAPMRQHYTISDDDRARGQLMLMPAWGLPPYLGVKVITVFPQNAGQSKPTVQGQYLLFSSSDGTPLAVLDGTALTLRRTAAISALAATFLARKDSQTLLMVGAGAMACPLIEAYHALFDIQTTLLWNRTASRAEVLHDRMERRGISTTLVNDLEAAVRRADIVTCATMSDEPLVRGAWLQPGTHVDLVGGYTPSMREVDDEAIRCATLFADTLAGVWAEAGDFLQPLEAGLITKADVQADLFALVCGAHRGRETPEEVTLFKSVGSAVSDLAAAAMLYEASLPK